MRGSVTGRMALPTLLSRGRRLTSGLGRWAAIATSRKAGGSPPLVSYGHARIPSARDPVNGGMVKFQRLDEVWPNERTRFDLLYLGSSSLPWDWRVLLRLSRRRGAPVLWNQNGVAYPAWAGSRTAAVNAPMATILQAADHVFFQSEFCRLAADTFLGPCRGPSEILHNAVDTDRFTPSAPREPRPLTLLLGGSQYERYRVETALRALREVRELGLDARLIVTGALSFAASVPEAERIAARLISELGLDGHVEFTGSYSQADAPALLLRGDVLLHTKVNDPCPGLVAEALACGLPVVYSASGGVPELVGPDAGIGVPATLDWERIEPPDPRLLADGVARVAERLEAFSAAARVQAVDHLDLKPWLERHREVFEELTR